MITEAEVQVGKIYSVQHVRKGHFVGEVLAIIPAPEGDQQDTFFIKMRVDVRAGTDQHRLANTKKEAVATKNIRPSLIKSMVETDQANWLRAKATPPKVDEAQQQQEALGQALRVALKQIQQEEATTVKKTDWKARLGMKH